VFFGLISESQRQTEETAIRHFQTTLEQNMALERQKQRYIDIHNEVAGISKELEEVNNVLEEQLDIQGKINRELEQDLFWTNTLLLEAGGLARGLADAAIAGESLADALERAARAAASRALAGLIGAGLGFIIGGGAGARIGFGLGSGINLPSGQHGLDFKVGGRPGVDQNVVAMRLTRGERVRVDPVEKSQERTVNLIVQQAQNRRAFEIDEDQFRDFMRSVGYRVIATDTGLGKGL
jgi:hypothetical protein